MSIVTPTHPALRAPLSRGDFGERARKPSSPLERGGRPARPGCVRATTVSLTFVLAASALSAAVDPSRLESADALFHTAGKSLEAQQAYEAIAADDSNNGTAHVRLGLLALRRDDTDAAIAALEKAVQLAPKNSAAHKALGDAYGRAAQKKGIFGGLGLGKKCLAQYQKAVELDPNNVDARASLFEFYRQAPGFAGGSAEKALAEAGAVKQLDPARGRLLFATFYAGEKKYDQAFAEFAAVLKTNPDDYAALYQTGRLAVTTGQQLDRGLAALRRCLELAPPTNQPGHAAAHWRIGNLLEKKSDKPGARAAYEAALQLDPHFTAAAEALKKLK